MPPLITPIKKQITQITNGAIITYTFFFAKATLDGLVKSQKTPSPLMREGRVGVKITLFQAIISPLPFIPSRQGRGNSTFYRFINVYPGLNNNARISKYSLERIRVIIDGNEFRDCLRERGYGKAKV